MIFWMIIQSNSKKFIHIFENLDFNKLQITLIFKRKYQMLLKGSNNLRLQS